MIKIAGTHSKADIAKGVIKYSFTPGILPQIKEITRGGFGFLAYLMAVVYHSVRIVPSNHPYLLQENFGKYGIRDVIAVAANHVRFSKQNIDQVLIFFAILSGVVILALQIVSFLFLILTGDAFAQAIFKIPNDFVETDMAFHLMREVFGIPEMFGPMPDGRTAMHQAFHMLLHFYNLAILLVAVLVFIYYVIVVVAETAQTGVPFGKRFSHIYAPFRLVIAVGLLVPLNYGLNGSQYISLFAAKLGSSLATNAWIGFNEIVENPTGMENAALIAESKPPDTVGLVNFMAVAVTCSEAYTVRAGRTIEMYQEEKTPDGGTRTTLVNSASPEFAGVGSDDVRIIFGAQNPQSEMEDIVAYCGSVVVPIVVPMGETINGTPGKLQEKYLELITGLWSNTQLRTWGFDFACAQSGENDCGSLSGGYHPPSTERDKLIQDTQNSVDAIIKTHYEDARETDFALKEEVLKLGWGGSAKYYNLIAQVNGAYVVATFNVPVNDKWPAAMEYVLEEKRRSDSAFPGCNMFKPNLADNSPVTFDNNEDGEYYARTLNDVYKYWNCNQDKTASNVFIDTVAAIFGLQGLISIRDRAEGEGGNEVDIHPLAKLSVLGRGLVENAIRSLAVAMGASAFGGALGILSPHFGEAAQAASSMFVSIATIGLSVGFLTYYILPFMPFMYFFFAVGSWIKSIFEAMVGAPLWALAHLRIDGDGLSGKMASNGYFLIFEIFLRPILTLCGLLGGIAIFTALANTLNEVFDVVVLNTADVNLSKDEPGLGRHVIDVFFFTVMYAVILYMMAVSSFKMINIVPNGILRWIGTGATPFSDNAGDPTQGLTQYAAIGGAKIGGEIAGAATQLSGAAGHSIAGAYRTANPRQSGNG
jgi:conjugal transfer/type IV secretion protein DotA/TraY